MTSPESTSGNCGLRDAEGGATSKISRMTADSAPRPQDSQDCAPLDTSKAMKILVRFASIPETPRTA